MVDEQWVFGCEHGPEECITNKLHACVMKRLHSHKTKMLKVLKCLINKKDQQVEGLPDVSVTLLTLLTSLSYLPLYFSHIPFPSPPISFSQILLSVFVPSSSRTSFFLSNYITLHNTFLNPIFAHSLNLTKSTSILRIINLTISSTTTISFISLLCLTLQTSSSFISSAVNVHDFAPYDMLQLAKPMFYKV